MTTVPIHQFPMAEASQLEAPTNNDMVEIKICFQRSDLSNESVAQIVESPEVGFAIVAIVQQLANKLGTLQPQPAITAEYNVTPMRYGFSTNMP